MANPLFSQPSIVREDRPDGSILLRSTEPLSGYPPTVMHTFAQWATTDPDHVLVAERDGEGGWREVTYGEALAATRSIGQALLDMGLGPHRPLLMLSGNGVAHMLTAMGALGVGIPIAPTSVAYSLQSQDHARIKQIAELITPGAVFADDGSAFSKAIGALGDMPRIVAAGEGDRTLDELRAIEPTEAVDAAFAALTHDSLAKIQFTSGSTGSPKGVQVTHGMWSANQQMMREVWPFLSQERPVIVDWLPWSHTFGGNHNVGMVLVNGGTLYIDGGRPAPGLFDTTLRNVAEHPPTIYFNVPAGFAQLIPTLENDAEFAATFFSRLRLVFNAAAALPPALRQRMRAVAETTTGHPVAITGSWGLTETAPAVTNAHYDFDESGNIGVPIPGAEVKLAPAGDAYEIRARGPMVTPGYFARPDLTKEAFDEEGYYKTGDAVVPADPDDPNRGLLFRGRLAEDFKLDTGTFVRVGAVRTALLSSCPLLADAVITGESASEVCALAWTNAAEISGLLGREATVEDEVVVDPDLSGHIAKALADHNGRAGTAGQIRRLLLMARPADLDSGEITDKGYVNQRKVREVRAHLVDRLYAPTDGDAAVITSGDRP
ncbi:feruloyl-CoA synthase [Janibacter alittae]|uniref:Feruloyl-CoA synthase n=1 Tax=Janibacter alittae TaxID=3115209 RepID=A0ABZ2MKP9_9MICO